MPVAGLFCAAVSVLIGLPILRLRGVYFAMVTLVSTEVARLAALALPITNGATGMVNLPLPGADQPLRPDPRPGFRDARQPSASPSTVCRVTIMLLVLCRASTAWSIRASASCSPSLQQNEELASSIGVNIAGLRVIAYAISSFLGGIAGAIFVGDLAVDLSVELHRRRLDQFHAELLPRRARLRLRADDRHLRPLLRLGPPVPDRRSSSC